MIPAIVPAFAYGETRVRIEADVQDADLLHCAADFGAHQRAPHEAGLAGGRRGVLARNGPRPVFRLCASRACALRPTSPPHWFAGPAAGTGVDQTEGKRYRFSGSPMIRTTTCWSLRLKASSTGSGIRSRSISITRWNGCAASKQWMRKTTSTSFCSRTR